MFYINLNCLTQGINEGSTEVKPPLNPRGLHAGMSIEKSIEKEVKFRIGLKNRKKLAQKGKLKIMSFLKYNKDCNPYGGINA